MSVQALREASVPLAEQFNGETIRQLREDLKNARAENFRRRDAFVTSQAKLTAAIDEWFSRDRESLVVDIDGETPVLIHTLMERIFDDDAEAIRLHALALAAAAHAGVYPRRLCGNCGNVECHDVDTDIEIPLKVRNLIAEVRRG